jgi:hypothetical protein
VAVPAVSYNAEVPLEFSEIDPVQNRQVDHAVRTTGFRETAVWNALSGGGPVTSIALTSGGSGYTLTPVVTISGNGSGASAVATMSGGAVTGITITSDGDGYSSAAGSTTVTITPAAADTGTITAATATATVTMGGCGGAAHTCYPPAVNYTPFYFLINGQAFDKTNPSRSLFAATAGVSGTPPAPVTNGIPITPGSTILVRLVNAGLRMHVPSIVGSQTQGFTGAGALTALASPVGGFTLIAEDGNPVPDLSTATATAITGPVSKPRCSWPRARHMTC